MMSYRIGTVNDFYWGVKPVFRSCKHCTYLTLGVNSCYSYYVIKTRDVDLFFTHGVYLNVKGNMVVGYSMPTCILLLFNTEHADT